MEIWLGDLIGRHIEILLSFQFIGFRFTVSGQTFGRCKVNCDSGTLNLIGVGAASVGSLQATSLLLALLDKHLIPVAQLLRSWHRVITHASSNRSLLATSTIGKGPIKPIELN